MLSGRLSGREGKGGASRPRLPEGGVGAFVREDGGSTSLAAATAILVSLALVFSLAAASWVQTKAADTQVVADAGALAAANTLACYSTVVQILDAVVLSLGLVGILALAVGVVLCAIPVVDLGGAQVVQAARSLLEVRTKLSRSAAQGLSKLEEALPFLMAANSAAAIRANVGEAGDYLGVALPFPLEGTSDFGKLDVEDTGDLIGDLLDSSGRLDDLTDKAEEAKAAADEARERGWQADCGPGEYSMRQRAQTLAGLSGAANPYYPSSDGWGFGVAIERARAYYAARLAQEGYEGGDAKELARSQARRVFYEYALREVNESSAVVLEDGSVALDLHELPENTADMRETSLYLEVRWPCTVEGSATVIHASLDCPGAEGAFAGMASLSQQDSGEVGVCAACEFTIADLGMAASAPTNFENGFEHWWREVVRASRDYQEARNEQASQETQARQEAEKTKEAFQEAIGSLGVVRIDLSPPGRYGVVCVVADAHTYSSPEELAAYTGGAELPPRVAVAAATLAEDPAAKGNTALSGFFDGLVAQGGITGGVGGVLDVIMSAWGDLLVSYDSGYDAVMGATDTAFSMLTRVGMGSVAEWLKTALRETVSLAGIEPVDLSAKKPVLTNTNDVMALSGNSWYRAVHSMIVAAPSLGDAQDVSSVLQAMGLYTQALTGSDTIEVAKLEIPGTTLEIPIRIDFGWLAEVTAS